MQDKGDLLEGFDDIAPLRGEAASTALKALLEKRDWEGDLSRLIPAQLASDLVHAWSNARGVEDFQECVVKPFLEGLMVETTKGLSWSGSEKGLDEGMLYLSNHRDIVLDPSLVNVVLLNRGRGSTEIGIGSNLLSSPWIEQLVRLNRCFVVHRSGSARERYAHSIRTASYIRAVVQSGTPVWLAHREGRAKDGRDTTAPALMRTLSDGCAPEVWNALHTTPVSISYEWDPCDALKVHELLSKDAHGAYVKSDGEDELSMWLGLSGAKGRVHLEFGDPLEWRAHTDERKPERGMAFLFDVQLHKGMRHWANQRLAAQSLGLSNAYYAHIDAPTAEEQRTWEKRKDAVESFLMDRGWSREEAGRKWCEMLTAPLVLRESLLHDAGHSDGTGH